MRKLLIQLFGLDTLYKVRKSPVVNFLPRLRQASRSYNHRYGQILRWGIESREDTNFTYELTEDNLLYLAHTVAVVAASLPKGCRLTFEKPRPTSPCGIIFWRKPGVLPTGAWPTCAWNLAGGWAGTRWYDCVSPPLLSKRASIRGWGRFCSAPPCCATGRRAHPAATTAPTLRPKRGICSTDLTVRLGRCSTAIRLPAFGLLIKPIDLFINDSDHSATYEHDEYRVVLPKLSPTGIMLSDNAHETGVLARLSLEVHRKFVYYQEVPKDHWFPGAGIGFSY